MHVQKVIKNIWKIFISITYNLIARDTIPLAGLSLLPSALFYWLAGSIRNASLLVETNFGALTLQVTKTSAAQLDRVIKKLGRLMIFLLNFSWLHLPCMFICLIINKLSAYCTCLILCLRLNFSALVAGKLCKGIRHQQHKWPLETLLRMWDVNTQLQTDTRRQFNSSGKENRQNGEWGTRQRRKGAWQGRRKAASKGRLLYFRNLKLSLRRY